MLSIVPNYNYNILLNLVYYKRIVKNVERCRITNKLKKINIFAIMNTPQKTLPVGYVLNSDERKYTILGVIGQGASCTAYLAVRLEK